MKTECSNRREIISKGMENIVLRPATRSPNIVLKIPRIVNYLSMLGRDQAEVLRQELAEAYALVDKTTVRIPKTIVISGKERWMLGIKTRGYVIGQRYIEEDGTVPDMANHLSGQGLNSLVDEYKHEPRNFVSNSGIVYWIDPTKGTAGRVLDDTKMMKLETYRRIRRKLSRLIRFVGM